MIVSELIEHLSKMPNDLLVCIANEGFDDDYDSMQAEFVSRQTIEIKPSYDDDHNTVYDEDGEQVYLETEVVMISCC